MVKKSGKSKTTVRYVYFFGDGKADGEASMKDILGGKGANLAEMSSIGVPVPAGFTISTDVCEYYYKHGKKKPSELQKQIDKNIKKLEKSMGAKLGDPKTLFWCLFVQVQLCLCRV